MHLKTKESDINSNSDPGSDDDLEWPSEGIGSLVHQSIDTDTLKRSNTYKGIKGALFLLSLLLCIQFYRQYLPRQSFVQFSSPIKEHKLPDYPVDETAGANKLSEPKEDYPGHDTFESNKPNQPKKLPPQVSASRSDSNKSRRTNQPSTSKNKLSVGSKKILYIVRSYSGSYERRLSLQAQTWMTRLDRASEAIFIASRFSPDELEKRRYARLPDRVRSTFVTPKCTENNHGMGLCCQEANAFLMSAKEEFDWFFFIDDDVFVSPSILRQIVMDYNESSLVSIGTKGCVSQSYHGFCGGGGYLVSRAALKKTAALPNFVAEYMRICNMTQYCDIVTAWMLENEANTTLLNDERFHPWGMDVTKVLDKNYDNEAWEITHSLIHRRQKYISQLKRFSRENSSQTPPHLPTMDMYDHLLRVPKVLHAVASRQYATLHYFGGDLTKVYSTKIQKIAFLNLLYDVALNESPETKEEEPQQAVESVESVENVDYTNRWPFSQQCLRDTKLHPVPNRESLISVNLRPDLASIRTVRDHLAIGLKHLDESSTVEKIRLLPFEIKCVRNLTPKKFHWIWFGSELPEKYVSNIEAMATMNPGWAVFLWSEYESKTLFDRMEKHRVQYNFKNVTRYIQEGLFVNGDLIARESNMAGKSDYARYEVVYLEGGIYHDTDARPVQPFDNFGDLYRWPFVTYDTRDAGYGNLCNCVFGFEKGSRLLEFAMQLTRENCLRYKTCGVMSGAGPDFLTAAVSYFDDPDVVFIHKQHLIEQSFTKRSVTYHTFDATWLCRGKVCEGAKELDTNENYT